MQNQQNRNPQIVFLLTNLAFQALIGQLGIYSIIKKPMGELFSYDQQFFGKLQAILLICQILGSVTLLFIPINPVKGHFIFSCLNLISSVLILVPRYLPNQTYRDIIVFFCFCSSNFYLASLAYTQIIFSTYFDEDAKKCQHSTWYGLTFFGDIVSVVVAQVFIYNLGLKWEYVQLIWNGYLILVAILMSVYIGWQGQRPVAQIDQLLYEQSENQPAGQILHNQPNPPTLNQHHPHLHSESPCKDLLKVIIQTLKKPNIRLLVLSFGLIQATYSNLLLWLPYYYFQVNQQQYTMVSILVCCSSIAIGGFFIQIFVFQICKLEKYSHFICYGFLIVAVLAYFGVWLNRYSQPMIQIILLICANFFIASPYSRISSFQPIQQSNNNHHTIKIVFLLCHLSRNIIAATCVLAIGYLMKINSNYFWHVIMVTVFLAFLVESYRKLCMRREEDGEVKEGVKDS